MLCRNLRRHFVLSVHARLPSTPLSISALITRFLEVQPILRVMLRLPVI
jgi:hypothetical protein